MMRMRTPAIAIALAALWVGGCASEESLCDKAADHLEECLGEAAAPTGQCTDSTAEGILSQSCDDIRAGQAKGDLVDFLCQVFGIFCPPYEPCADKSCGDECTICDPSDPDCYETSVIKLCSADGACQASVPQCYEPCAGKSCGDSCTICDPNDPDCYETQEIKVCNADGACAAEVPVCDANCCDITEEPGLFGNPYCIEGATCCDDGTWQCNNGAAGSTCDTDGEVCEIVQCGGFLGLGCPGDDHDCVDYPLDDCDPANGGADCIGMCIPKDADCPLTGIVCTPACPDSGELPGGAPCTQGQYDVDTCECVPLSFCAGIIGNLCSGAEECVDYPHDDCDPDDGDNDCLGMCVDAD